MNQNTTLETKNLAEVGEDIGLQEGLELIQNFRVSNPNATPGYYIGRNILDQILAQPGCVGINFRKCLSNEGKEHLVYTGVDNNGADILNYLVVEINGELVNVEGIVADRSGTIDIGETLEEILRKIFGA